MNSQIEPKYTVDYFIQKFEAIPEERWTVKTFTDYEGRHCAAGHCGRDTIKGNYRDTEEARWLDFLFDRYLQTYPHLVNDGYRIGISPPICENRNVSPKVRILAALQEIKRWQELEKER